MAWATDPATWSVGDTNSAATMNAEVRDRFDFLLGVFDGSSSMNSDINFTGGMTSAPAVLAEAHLSSIVRITAYGHRLGAQMRLSSDYTGVYNTTSISFDTASQSRIEWKTMALGLDYLSINSYNAGNPIQVTTRAMAFQFGAATQVDLSAVPGVIYLDDVAADPSTDPLYWPTNGAFLYSLAGALYMYKSDGTKVLLATNT